MLYRILAVGDVVGRGGVQFLKQHLRGVQKNYGIQFTVVNGENAQMVGLNQEDAEAMFAAGADVVTLGNHSFGRTQIAPYLDDCPYILRPANLGGRAPGRGCGVYGCGQIEIGVINLIGRVGMNIYSDNPFKTVDDLLGAAEKPRFTLVDFHAEATSEKLAMAHYLDGRVSVLWGTHTHVPTADETVFPKGMGYISDLGMTGPINGVLGVEPRQSIEGFLGGLPGRYRAAQGSCKLQGAVFTLDDETGRCTGVDRIDIR